MNEEHALEELSQKVWEERRIVTYLLFKLTVARLLLASDERRFVADALAEVDKTVDLLPSWESSRDQALRDLAAIWRVDPSQLSLPELARRSPPPFDYTFSEHLQAFQQLATEIDEVTEQNRSLAGTSYDEVTRSIEMMTGPPVTTTTPVGWIGTGATVQDIARLRDQLLDDRFRASIGDAMQQGVRADVLTSMKDLTNEPDNGLTVRIERLWDAAETWSNTPADAASRRQVLTELSSIADGFRSIATACDRLGEDDSERRDTVVGSSNQLRTDLHDLNVRMTAAQAHRIGPDLNDQRDQMRDQLAEMLGTVARPTPDGGVRITLNGVEPLGPDTQAVSPAVQIDGDGSVVVTDGSVVVTDGTGAEHAPIPDAQVAGELGGLQHILQEDLPTWRGRLDTLAVGDVDIARGVMELQVQQIAYEATLQALAKALPPSLGAFLP